MGVGTSRRAEATALLIAVIVLGLVVGAFAIVASNNQSDFTIEASGESGGDDADDNSSLGLAASPTTAHGHADGEDHADAHAAGEEHADGGEHAHDDGTDATHGHDDGDASGTHSHSSTGATGGTHDDEHAHGPTVPGQPSAPHDDGHTHPSGPTVPGATTPHDDGHSHPPGPTVPGQTTPPTHAHDPCDVSWDHDDGHGGHGDGPNVQIALVRQCYPSVGAQIDSVTAWAMANAATGDAARAQGWTPGTAFFPGIAAHWLKGGTAAAVNLDATFDPLSPEVLLYGPGANPQLVGINYIVRSGPTPPAGFPGDWDVWHEHQWLCVDLAKFLVVGESATANGCASGQYAYDFRGHWLLHVWSIPGWDSPQGIFSHSNSRV